MNFNEHVRKMREANKLDKFTKAKRLGWVRFTNDQ